MSRSFVMTQGFEQSWSRMGLGDDELLMLQNLLIEDPGAGDVIQGTGGARKVKIPLGGRGKSGGGRVIYVDVVIKERIYLLMAYPQKCPNRPVARAAESSTKADRIYQGGMNIGEEIF